MVESSEENKETINLLPVQEEEDHSDALEWHLPSGLKIMLKSSKYDAYQLSDLAIQLKELSNGSGKDKPKYT